MRKACSWLWKKQIPHAMGVVFLLSAVLSSGFAALVPDMYTKPILAVWGFIAIVPIVLTLLFGAIFVLIAIFDKDEDEVVPTKNGNEKKESWWEWLTADDGCF